MTTTTPYQRRHAPEPTTGPPTRADFASARARDREDQARYQDAYDRGRSGDPDRPEAPDEAAAYDAGRGQARRDRVSGAVDTGRKVAARTRTGVRAVKRTARTGVAGAVRQADTGSWSVMGLVWGGLGLIVLFLLVRKAGLAAKVVTSVTRATAWFISPRTLPI